MTHILNPYIKFIYSLSDEKYYIEVDNNLISYQYGRYMYKYRTTAGGWNKTWFIYYDISTSRTDMEYVQYLKSNTIPSNTTEVELVYESYLTERSKL